MRVVRDYFVGEDPTFWVAMVPMLAIAAVLFTRHLQTNYIFDEQEALLANPYVNGQQGLRPWHVIYRDFWGLPHERSIGSYRPLPNLVWRGVWAIRQSPWLAHWMNVLFHAANGALVVMFTFRVTRRRGLAWVAGAVFTASAVLTEAVSGVVGIADVMGGMGALLALASLSLGAPLMPFAVALSVLFGLFSKESALVLVPLVPWAALVLAPVTHPGRPRRLLRAALALVATVGAFVLYVEMRKRWFPAPMEPTLNDPLPEGASWATRAHRAFMVWFHQPPLPKDPLNNPFIKADAPHRVAGALRVYFRGLVQVVLPRKLAGDYSAPEEPVPASLTEWETVLGAVMMVVPVVGGLGAWARGLWLERRLRRDAQAGVAWAPSPALTSTLLVALGALWIVVSYFPHSNIPVLLPTVRAERFWYFPVIGSTLVLAVAFAWLFDATKKQDSVPAVGLFAFFFLFQCGAAYRHSRDYRDDLTFWDATRHVSTRSAKAHLNYSVMQGARGRQDLREASNRTALALAPDWPMAHVYLGDTLCRQHRVDEAWAHYKTGFPMADNDPNLLTLGLQCLWEERAEDENGSRVRAFHKYERALLDMADTHPGSWLAYHVRDVSANGEKNDGVDPKYRPRGYNQPAKE